MSARWIALAGIGQASSLGLYVAGPVVSYHHYRLPETMGPLWWAAVCGLGLQIAVAGVELVRRRAWVRRWLAPWQILVFTGLLAVSGTKIARPPAAFAVETVLATAVQIASLACLVFAAADLPGPWVSRFRDWWDRGIGAPDPGQPRVWDGFAGVLALLLLVVTAALCAVVYERHPHVPDELIYLVHAEYLAQGKLTLPPPPVPAAFDIYLAYVRDGRWFSSVNPGWPFALAAGAFFGAAWLVNPILSALCVLATYAFVREIADRPTARLSALLLSVSPWFVFLGMSFMNHQWTLLCALAAAYGVARTRRTGGVLWCAIAGVAIGMVSLIRPLEGLVVSVLLGLWGLIGRVRIPALATLVIATGASGAVVFPYNAMLTGDPKVHPIMDFADREFGKGTNNLGFGPDKGTGWGGLDPWPGHDPFQAAVNAQFNTFALNAELFGWAAGSLVLVFLAALWRGRRGDGKMWLVIAAIVGSNSLYWFSGGPDFGPRYWFLVIIPCIWLTISGLSLAESRLDPADQPRARFALLAACALALLTFFPWRAIDKYPNYRGMRADVRRLAEKHQFGRSLVLVQGKRHPDYHSAFAYNQLDWDADAPIYVWDKNSEIRSHVLARYPDRPVWIVAGPTVTGEGFRVVAGPLESKAALAEAPPPD